MILITKENKYINLDNAQEWWTTENELVISFGMAQDITIYKDEESAKKAINNIRQGLLKKLLFVKL